MICSGPCQSGHPVHAVGQRNCIYGPVMPTRCGSCLALSTNTMLTIALCHLLGRGVRLETHEAVALARELLAHPCGIPTPENIELGSDGSASCVSTDGMLSIASVADLL